MTAAATFVSLACGTAAPNDALRLVQRLAAASPGVADKQAQARRDDCRRAGPSAPAAQPGAAVSAVRRMR
jgi:hypothetical protein